MLADKKFTDFTSLFSPYDFKKNDGIILSYWKCYFKVFFNNRNKLLSITRSKKKKHDKILMLAKSKLDSIETLVSQALIAMEISHGELNVIIRDKQKYERIKENVTNVFEKQKNMRLNSLNSRTITSLWIIHVIGNLEWLNDVWELSKK